jgi:serine protease Do
LDTVDGTDLALIEMNYFNFSACPSFKIEYGEVLEEILTMGYPPIPGFDAVQVADISHIGGSVKVSKGKIVAEERTLWDPETNYLINARVKGGNSGGPIINNLGFAIGMIVDIPLNPDDQEKIDHLAYGVALTGRRIKNFINDVNLKNDKVEKIQFQMNKEGFSTLK